MIDNTVKNPPWVADHRAALLALLPETWTHVSNLNLSQIGYSLKLLGVDWRSVSELADCFAALEIQKLLLRDGNLVRRANL